MKLPSRRRTAGRAKSGRDVATLEDIPNVGPAVAAELRRLGITIPADLLGRDPYALYEDLCEKTGQRHHPCLLDTFIAAVRFMVGGAEEALVVVQGGTKTRIAESKAKRPG